MSISDKPLIKDVIRTLEDAFPPHYQEDFDNTGLQVGSTLRVCTGVLLCVDVTPEIVVEAAQRHCNLIISHHPLIFHPLKAISYENRVDISINKAIRNDITIYSCHTSVDNTPLTGVSWQMGRMLRLDNIEPLEQRGAEAIGSGIIGNLHEPLLPAELIALVKATFSSPIVRCSQIAAPDKPIARIALCGGAGAFLIPKAIEAGAQAFITSDSKHNHFIDHVHNILLIDIGHYESECCATAIFANVLLERLPGLPVFTSSIESNPINYL